MRLPDEYPRRYKDRNATRDVPVRNLPTAGKRTPCQGQCPSVPPQCPSPLSVLSLYPQHLFYVLPLMVKITDLHFLLIDLNGLAGRTFKSFPNWSWERVFEGCLNLDEEGWDLDGIWSETDWAPSLPWHLTHSTGPTSRYFTSWCKLICAKLPGANGFVPNNLNPPPTSIYW